MTVVYWFWVPELSQLIRMLIHKLMTKIPTSCVTQHLGCQPFVPYPHKDSYLTHVHGVHHLRANSILSLGLSVWNHFQETVLLYNPTSLLSLLKAWPGSPRTRGSLGNAEEHFTILENCRNGSVSQTPLRKRVSLEAQGSYFKTKFLCLNNTHFHAKGKHLD